jgi:hypothetical protein
MSARKWRLGRERQPDRQTEKEPTMTEGSSRGWSVPHALGGKDRSRPLLTHAGKKKGEVIGAGEGSELERHFPKIPVKCNPADHFRDEPGELQLETVMVPRTSKK